MLLAVHVPAGLIAVMSGGGAMLAQKGGRSHRRRGLVYLGALAAVSLSGVGLGITRGPGFLHLLGLGLAAAALAAIGFTARRRRDPTVHLLCMAASYIAMLTAFYVDNGPKLPLWNRLPPAVFWFLPALLGLPLCVLAVHRHGKRSRIATHGLGQRAD